MLGRKENLGRGALVKCVFICSRKLCCSTLSDVPLYQNHTKLGHLVSCLCYRPISFTYNKNEQNSEVSNHVVYVHYWNDRWVTSVWNKVGEPITIVMGILMQNHKCNEVENAFMIFKVSRLVRVHTDPRHNRHNKMIFAVSHVLEITRPFHWSVKLMFTFYY